MIEDAFRPEHMCFYSHELPFATTNYVDGMFHVGMMTWAAKEDIKLRGLGQAYLSSLLACGKDARNFSNQMMLGWEFDKMLNVWVKRSPQSFAGPVGLYLANQVRFTVIPDWIPNPTSTARMFVKCGWAFGYAVRWISWLRQHVNSMFLAYLFLDEVPPESMEWLAFDNPFYMAIYKKKYTATWPGRKTTKGYTVEESSKVPFGAREPDAWPAKNYPYKRYVADGESVKWEYTPICEYVAGRMI